MVLEDVKALVETEVKALLNQYSDQVVASVLKQIEEAIPGSIDDAIIGASAPEIEKFIKEQLLALADKISDKV